MRENACVPSWGSLRKGGAMRGVIRMADDIPWPAGPNCIAAVFRPPRRHWRPPRRRVAALSPVSSAWRKSSPWFTFATHRRRRRRPDRLASDYLAFRQTKPLATAAAPHALQINSKATPPASLPASPLGRLPWQRRLLFSLGSCSQ